MTKKANTLMGYRYVLVVEFEAPAELIYQSWLDSAAHTAMTRGIAVIDPKIGGTFSAYDGYITGTILELEPGRRIKQTWRTTDFDDHPDSTVEIILTEFEETTRFELTHSGVPEEQTIYEEAGWRQNYFEPMAFRFDWATQIQPRN